MRGSRLEVQSLSLAVSVHLPSLVAIYSIWDVLMACQGSVAVKPPSKGWTFIGGGTGALSTAAVTLAVDLAPIRVNTIACGVVCQIVDPQQSGHIDLTYSQVLTEVRPSSIDKQRY